MNNVRRFEQNVLGTDYVCGDIHGMFQLLEDELRVIGFDYTKDRLFCTGDLVDRGSDSDKVLQYLSEPWFFSVMGNHDAQYAFYNYEFNGRNLCCYPIDEWSLSLGKTERNTIFNGLYDHLYPAIEVQTSTGLVGIVHACIPTKTWAELVHQLNAHNHNTLYECMWNRSSAKSAQNGEDSDAFVVPDIHHVFHGHTIDIHGGCGMYSIGNRYFIDTGANLTRFPDQYPGAKLTILRLDLQGNNNDH